MKNKIFSGWNFMRFLRLIIGVSVIVQGLIIKDWMFVTLGTLFSLMPILNVGCCGTSYCNTTLNNTNKNTDEVTFEEIKNK